MSDLKKYVYNRKKRDPEFSKDFEAGYGDFKIGAMLRLAREKAGLTQEQLAKKLKTKKSAISRIENHAEDIKLSTLKKFATAVGRQIQLQVV